MIYNKKTSKKKKWNIFSSVSKYNPDILADISSIYDLSLNES